MRLAMLLLVACLLAGCGSPAQSGCVHSLLSKPHNLTQEESDQMFASVCVVDRGGFYGQSLCTPEEEEAINGAYEELVDAWLVQNEAYGAAYHNEE